MFTLSPSATENADAVEGGVHQHLLSRRWSAVQQECAPTEGGETAGLLQPSAPAHGARPDHSEINYWLHRAPGDLTAVDLGGAGRKPPYRRT